MLPSLATLDIRHAEFSRILLIKPSAVGDVVHTLPVLEKLRRRYPQARIDWLLTPENAQIVRGHPAHEALEEGVFRFAIWHVLQPRLRGGGIILRQLIGGAQCE